MVACYYALLLLESDAVAEGPPDIFTKSGLMVGLGEQRLEVHQVMDDMRSAVWSHRTHLVKTCSRCTWHAKVESCQFVDVQMPLRQSPAKGFCCCS